MARSANPDKVFPLSLSQQQVWLDQLSHPDSPHFNIGGIGYIHGELDLALYKRALALMVKESEALRLLPLPNGQQKLIDGWAGELLEYFDHSEDNEPKTTILKRLKHLMSIPFTIDGHQRPWQVTILKHSDNCHAMAARFHHLIMDGYSVALATRRLSAIYNALLYNRSTEEDKPNYTDFLTQSATYANSNSIIKDAEYWQQKIPTTPQLLLSKANQQDNNNTSLPPAHHHYYFIESEQYHSFQSFSRSLKATTFHLFIAALAMYFCRCYNKSEIVFGLPVLNRGGKRYKDTLGMFVGMIPLKVDIAKHKTVDTLIGEVNQALRGAYRHSRYPLSQLVERLNMVQQRQDRLFDIVISFEIQDFTVKFGEAPLSKVQQLFSPLARYPLAVSICEFHDEDPVEVAFEANSEYFTKAQAQRLGERLQHLMIQMSCTDCAEISTLPLMLEAERDELIFGKHQDVPEHPNPLPYISAFEHQAALRPQETALKWIGGSLSYEALNQGANRLAHKLQQFGVEKGDIVAVVLPRKSETVMALLAVNKTCAAFTPIDPDAPHERILQLIENSHAVAVISDNGAKDWRSQLTIPEINVEGPGSPYCDNTLPQSNLTDKPSAEDLVYLLFTSGSTGTPKGVLMSHGPLARRLAWLGRTFKFTPKDIWLQSIQLTFDPAMLELFLPLIRGGVIALAPPGQVPPTELASLAEVLEATCMIFVPTTLRFFNRSASNLPNLKLRIAISGGELLHRQMAQAFVNHTGAQLYNFYGPTEACIFATVHKFDKHSQDDPIPIGSAVDDTRIYILDNNQQPLPTGMTGQIYIGGNGLANGYLNNNAANQRFVADPFMPGMRMYGTGDNGYYDENGNIQFVGRIDNQIKLSGQRIEPGEIESVLCDMSFIKAAAVKKLDNSLHAWLVLEQPNSEILLAKMRKVLLAKLPGHMIPAQFSIIDAMPQQSSGKTDYQKLKPNPLASPLAETSADNKPIGNDLEKLMQRLWQETLKRPNLSLDSDFFHYGGDSLKALKLLEIIRQQMGQRLPLSMLLHNTTPRMLAKALIERHQPLVINLSHHEFGTPVYLAASGHGDAVRFVHLAKALGHEYHLFMLQPPELEGYTTYHTIGELAQYYADIIAHRHHNTPPVIAGFSVAGISALETVRRLLTQGAAVAGLVMIDTTYPQRIFNRPLLWRLCRTLINSLKLQELSINQRTMGSLFNDPGLNGQIYAIRGYRPAPLSIPVNMIISSGFNRWYRLLFKPWQKIFAKHLQLTHLEGFHGTLFNQEHVSGVVKVIEKAHNNTQ